MTKKEFEEKYKGCIAVYGNAIGVIIAQASKPISESHAFVMGVVNFKPVTKAGLNYKLPEIYARKTMELNDNDAVKLPGDTKYKKLLHVTLLSVLNPR